MCRQRRLKRLLCVMARLVLQLRMTVRCVRLRQWFAHTCVYSRNAKMSSELQATLRWCRRGHMCGLHNR